MPLHEALYLILLFMLTAWVALEVLRGLWARRRRPPLAASHAMPEPRFGARLFTHALATLGAVVYVFLTAHALTRPGWLPVLLMGNLVFGLLLTAWLRVVPAAAADAWTVRDRIWCRLVHALLWPLHALRGRQQRQ